MRARVPVWSPWALRAAAHQASWIGVNFPAALTAVALGRLARIFDFGRIDSDESNDLRVVGALHDKGVTVADVGNGPSSVGVGGPIQDGRLCCRRWLERV